MIDLDKQNELFRRAVNGDSSAREQMIIDNMAIARHVACSLISGSGMSYDDGEDEIQAAYLIMVETIDKMIAAGYMYNVKYLTTCLSNGLKSYYRKEKYGVDNNSMTKDEKQKERLLRVRNPHSIDSDLLDGYVSDKNELDVVVDNIYVNELLSNLNESERELVDLMFYHGLTQKEIAKRLGVKQNTISVRYHSILSKLRGDK